MKTSWEQPFYTTDVDAVGVMRVLESIRDHCPDCKFYQASTSEMYGLVKTIPQNEDTPFHPRSPYGVAKLYGHWITKNYRESFGLKTCSGILFNHESPLRGAEFVTRKITLGLARIACGKASNLELGSLEAQRDWGFAGDYVEGMWKMLQADQPDDYVLATGKTTTIRKFVEIVGESFGMDIAWTGTGLDEIGIDKKTDKPIISINEAFYRPAKVEILLGDATKAKTELGWTPIVGVTQLAHMMAKADYDRVKTDRVAF